MPLICLNVLFALNMQQMMNNGLPMPCFSIKAMRSASVNNEGGEVSPATIWVVINKSSKKLICNLHVPMQLSIFSDSCSSHY